MLKPTITVIAQSLLISPLVILQPGVSHAQQPSQTDALNQARAGIEQLSANHAQLSSENKNSHRQYNQQGFQMENITLNTEVGNLAANLYLPKGITNPPVVVVTGAWTSVKEQMPAVYAKALAERGYAAVTFDFRGWGASRDTDDNQTAYLEDPVRKTQDIQAVIKALSNVAQVDNSRIAGLAICASAGYMLDAAVQNTQLSQNTRLGAVAVVAPWLHDEAMATAIYGGEENRNQLLALAAAEKDKSKPLVIEAASLTNENALMYNAPYYTEQSRGLLPAYDNKFNVTSWSGWLNYNAQLSASKQTIPVLMVASEAMALPQGAHQYLETATDSVNAIWLDNINQFDFYDQPEAVEKAVKAVVSHFDSAL